MLVYSIQDFKVTNQVEMENEILTITKMNDRNAMVCCNFGYVLMVELPSLDVISAFQLENE